MALDELPLLSSGPEHTKFSIWREVKQQLWIAGPMLFVNLLQFLIPLTSVMFVGHLGKLPLSGASLATSSCNVTGFIILMGLSAALETLCGQAYGAQQYSLMGIYLQRSIIVLLAVCIPISVLWFNMENVLVSVGQDPLISECAGIYARYLIPALFAQALTWPMMKFLQSQSVIIPMTASSALSVVVHIPLCWFLLYKLQIGGHGAALCVSFCFWLNAIFLAVYVKFFCKKTFPGFSWETFRDFYGFFKLGLPAVIMICLEAWTYEFITILSGLMPNPQLETATATSLMNTSVLLYMVPYSLSAAASTRAANELGAGNPDGAKAAVKVTLCMALIDMLAVVTIILSFRNTIGWAFSSDADVVANIADIFNVSVFIAAFDTIQGVLTGVCRGCGWQSVGAVANLFAFYVVGLPVAMALGFVYKQHGKGLWTGIATGNATQTLVLCLMTFFTNWEQLAEKARSRILESVRDPENHRKF